MNKILNMKLAVSAIVALMLVVSCELDEFNPNTASIDLAYETPEGFEGLLNYCYNGLYYFYGKIDGIGAMELGTDLWHSESKEKGFAQYGSEMTTEMGTLRVFWQGFYSTINYCNTAIYFIDQVDGYTEEQRNAKIAEAYFLRGWSNLHIVEQFGGVVLNEEPSIILGAQISPTRSTEAEFYDLIISDLIFACEHLPTSQNERGRVTKKAAYGMLAKAYLQRTRLGEENTQEYARLALETAQELIDNQADYNCALYTSDASESGYTKLWDGENNKENTEFLFIEAVDHEGGLNPDGWNRGRTRQYYLMDLRTVGGEWGTSERGCAWYSRANDRGIKPTKYLLTEIFEPVDDPADTRFSETFFTQYFNSSGIDKIIDPILADKYFKDNSVYDKVILNTAGTYNTTDEYYGGRCYYDGISASGNVNMVDNDGDGYLDGLSVFTPNYIIPAEEKAMMPFLCVDPTDMFKHDGQWVTDADEPLGSSYKNCYPSMRKLSSLYWIYSNQHWQGDVPILRLGEVYLIAAEASLRYNNNQATAATYVNAIRERAAVSGRATDMTVSATEVTLDFILEERARELAGEQVRWVDLKRFGKLTSTYLSSKNPDIIYFDDYKNTVRPIPQTFLDAISNPDEFGTNGY